MKCPRCDYQPAYAVVQCPRCGDTFDAGKLEELGHLTHLRARLKAWQEAGLLSPEAAAATLEATEEEIVATKLALGLLAPSVPARPEPVAAAAPTMPQLPPAAQLPTTVPSTLAPKPLAPVEVAHGAPPPRPALPTIAEVGRAFSWSQVGTYLLSERTLHVLLALGTLLILASGVVISTLNPTGLEALPHLAVMIATTLVFYSIGYLVRRQLRLTTTGATLLAIGGAFVPLDIWTVGQEGFLSWEPAAVWLLASLVCLPIYFGSHAIVRDRSFAVFTALAGGSELLALLNWLGVSLEGGFGALVALALLYVGLASRLRATWPLLAWALFWVARIATPLLLLALTTGKYASLIWQLTWGRAPSHGFGASVVVAWWLGVAFYGLVARLFGRRRHEVLAAWSVPIAVLLTLAETSLDARWYSVVLGLLAVGYLLVGRLGLHLPRNRTIPYRTSDLFDEPVYQVAFTLSVVAIGWSSPSRPSLIAALLVVSLGYALAAHLLGQRVWAYLSTYLLPIAFALTLDERAVGGETRPLLWTILAGLLLTAAELVVRRTGEARRPFGETIVGRGAWRSRFGAPLFSAGYAVGSWGLASAVAWHLGAPVVVEMRAVSTVVTLALLTLVVIATASAVTRRTSGFLYLATWLFFLPFNTLTEMAFNRLGLALHEGAWAEVLGGLAVAYLILALVVDRFGGHYAKPFYLVSYSLSVAIMVLSSLDLAANVRMVGLSLIIYAASAWLVYRGRHPSHQWLVASLFHDPISPLFQAARAAFLYLVAWLFPFWLLLLLGLLFPSPDVAGAGLILSILAPLYVALGLGFRRIQAEYRLPWYIAGYALAVAGPLVATPDPNLRIITLGISTALFAVSAYLFRRAAWTYLVALLLPVLLLLAFQRFGVPTRWNGLGLITLALADGAVGLTLHHGITRRLLMPIRDKIGPYALPFFVIGYALNAIGLGLVVNQDRGLTTIGFALAALSYLGSAYVFRHGWFGYPLAATLAATYVEALLLLPLAEPYRGLGLLPGLTACLVIGEVLRRKLDRRDGDSADPTDVVAGVRIGRWSTPFYLALYLGTLAVPSYSRSSQSIWTIAWWSIVAVYVASTIIFRRPGWLYPAVLTSLVSYLATAYLLWPDLSWSHAIASLVVPTWLLFWSAYAVARAKVRSGNESLPELGVARALTHPWSAPLTHLGLGLLVLSTLGAVPNPSAGLVVALAYAGLTMVFAFVWPGQIEPWASLGFATIALDRGLAVLNVPTQTQPRYWALAALVLAIIHLIYITSSPVRKIFIPWRRPVYTFSLGVAILATALALLLYLDLRTSPTLRLLSEVVALVGLSLVAHGFSWRERRLGYLGVALLEASYMLQLVLADIGQPQLFVLPAGIYLLAIAYLEWRRGTGAGIKAAIESGALAIMLGTSVLQAIGFLGAGYDRYVYDTSLLVESLIFLGLGAALRWKRTFFAAALAIVVDVAILLADPIRATNTWYLLGTVGTLLIAFVVFLERRRQQIPLWIEDWRKRLEDWS